MTLDLFGEAKVEIDKPEPKTEVRLGHRSARVPLRKQQSRGEEIGTDGIV